MKTSSPRVLRLDGAYYDISNKTHLKSNKKIYNDVKKSDGVIYQSIFSKKVCDFYIGKARNSIVINNGADVDFFKNASDPTLNKKYKYNFLTASRWRSPKRLKQIVKSFNKWGKNSAVLWVAGNPDVSISGKNIIGLGSIGKKELASYLKISDAFIHICWVDSCPNGVVEAICSETPVVCNNQGGTPEIVKDRGIICGLDKKYNFKKMNHSRPPGIDLSKLVEAYEAVINLDVKINNDDLNINFIANEYLSFFGEIINGK
tara:strand:+ start:152 stop:931 length:780 start_codon:yes stop_codon:yes gene_type:complete